MLLLKGNIARGRIPAQSEYRACAKPLILIIARRCDYGLEDTPLLLIYLIKKDGGKGKNGRVPLNAHEDIVGISVIVSGESIGKSHARTLQIKMGPSSEVH